MNAKMLLGLGMLTLLAGTSAGAEGGKARPGNGKRPHKGEMLKRFDKDGDGKLSEAERQAAREGLKQHKGEFRDKLKAKFDKDGDGKLSEEEKMAAKEALKEHGGERREKLLERFDKDGDGKLSDEEKAAAKKAMQHHRGERKQLAE